MLLWWCCEVGSEWNCCGGDQVRALCHGLSSASALTTLPVMHHDDDATSAGVPPVIATQPPSLWRQSIAANIANSACAVLALLQSRHPLASVLALSVRLPPNEPRFLLSHPPVKRQSRAHQRAQMARHSVPGARRFSAVPHPNARARQKTTQ